MLAVRLLATALTASLLVGAGAAAQQPSKPTERAAPKPQTREAKQRVPVDPAQIEVDDGDTVVIQWGDNDTETVRILGIDTPETRHIEHDIPYDQPFGAEAKAFCRGAFAVASKIELLRAETLDPYGRTLGYLFVNDKNYSTLILRAGLAEESVTRYGDNGFPQVAAEVLAAAKSAGPIPFEPPGAYRNRMRTVTKSMKAAGTYPTK